ncbi:hypothetical protein FNF28_05158 [Cafeteria roenbergensis]|uniref:Amino acid transporter transmembrane domain-containing protein n=2 Tax=Cafeteria roenbergensis TaxID=33653 RepID=A0A5A8D8D1_CAFRO|nr:hypothetical protein FNF28_05158 [Cafeteria roenbergensis]
MAATRSSSSASVVLSTPSQAVSPKGDTDASKGGVARASFNFINSIIGAGVISLPFAFREAGFVAGVILLFVMAALTYYSVTLLVNLGVAARVLNYEMLARAALGRCGFVSVLIFQFLFAYGAMVAYLIITSDTLTVVIAHWAGLSEISFGLRAGVILAAATGIVLPLSCVRNMASLGWSSLASLVAVAWILVFTVLRAFTGGSDGAAGSTSHGAAAGEDWFTWLDPDRFWGAVSIVAFAFVCHHSSMLVYNSLENPTRSRWETTTRISVGTAALCSLVLATAGFASFGPDVKANLLNSFSSTDEMANATRVLFAATMVLTFPLEMYVTRHCLFVLMAGAGADADSAAAEGGPRPDSESHPLSAAPPPPAHDQALHGHQALASGAIDALSPASAVHAAPATPAASETTSLTVSAASPSGGSATGVPPAAAGAAGSPGSPRDPASDSAVAIDAASLPWWKHAALTMGLWVSCVAIAVAVEDLGIVVELTGGVSAVVIGFLVPGLIHLRAVVPTLFAWAPACCRGRLGAQGPLPGAGSSDGALADPGRGASTAYGLVAGDALAAGAGGAAGGGTAHSEVEVELAPSGTAGGSATGGASDKSAQEATGAALSSDAMAAPPPGASGPHTPAVDRTWAALWCEIAPTIVLLVFGVVALVTSTATALSNAASGGSGGGGAEV